MTTVHFIISGGLPVLEILHWSDPAADPPHSKALCGAGRGEQEIAGPCQAEFCVVCADLHGRMEVEW